MALEIVKGVYSVGVKDFKRRVFDSIIPLPKGTTYNSYLIIGSEKCALIDTVNPGFEQELLRNISEIADPSRIDYIVMNHAEPDHANAIPFMLEKAKNAKLIVSRVGAGAAKDYYEVPQERIVVVDEKTEIQLGGKTLRFINAPMLHWPETMFTYLAEDCVLFPCDFFGQHLAIEQNFDAEIDGKELEEHAKHYFGEIMMPFRAFGQQALKKLESYNVKIIAPSHGLVFTNPAKILSDYGKWTSGKLETKVLIAYVTMWGSCRKMADALENELSKKGVKCMKFDLTSADLGDVARELVDSACIVLSAPSFDGNVHPTAAYGAYLVRCIKPPAKYAAVISSYGWAPSGAKSVAELLAPLNLEIIGVVEAKARPKEADMQKVAALAGAIAQKVNAI